MKRATYTNRLTNETYTIAGVENLAQAWNLVNFACKRNGWCAIDLKVTIR
tara:strand:- start:2342 stop:2491 length:150 start_codon:yes stop_codon:yes gene_type:complete